MRCENQINMDMQMMAPGIWLFIEHNCLVTSC